MLQKDRARIPEDIMEASREGREVPVKMGERIGTAVSGQIQAAVIGAVNAGLSYAYGSLMTGGAGD